MLDLHSMVWLQPTVEGTPPAPREGASMAMLAGKVAVFGGHGSKQRFNDLYLLDTEVRGLSRALSQRSQDVALTTHSA